MDILAHGLWVGLGAAAWHRHRPQDRRTIGLAVGLAVLPDLVQLAPLVALTPPANAGVGDLLVAPTRIILNGGRGTEVILNNIGVNIKIHTASY